MRLIILCLFFTVSLVGCAGLLDAFQAGASGGNLPVGGSLAQSVAYGAAQGLSNTWLGPLIGAISGVVAILAGQKGKQKLQERQARLAKS